MGQTSRSAGLLAEQQVPRIRAKRYKGSFSIFGRAGGATIAKIVIYESGKGRRSGGWAPLDDGVYLLIRADEPASDAIWTAADSEFSEFGERFSRDVTLGVAPKHQERFAYSRLLPEDDPAAVARLIALCSRS